MLGKPTKVAKKRDRTINVFVFYGKCGLELKFLTLPRFGEEVCLPDDRGSYIVTEITHFARTIEDSEPKPTVQIRLRERIELHQRRHLPNCPRRFLLPVRYRSNHISAKK